MAHAASHTRSHTRSHARSHDDPGRPPVLILTGPTASGKSELALELAETFDGEIVNADSMQVYRYMDLGTAKPSLAERSRVPHHLFDIVTPDADYSAGRYAEDARRVVAEIHARGRLPILVGGTGLYIRAFLHGLVSTGAANAELRERLEREQRQAAEQGDPERLHRRLEKVDPVAAAAIHPNDVRRTVRALEIVEQANAPASQVRGEHGFESCPYRVLHLAVDPGREALDERIDRRCERMIESGLLQEVRGLRSRRYQADLRPMQAIGYRHIQPVVDGDDTLANALKAMKADTRRFARRQRTWLRKVPDVIWVDPADREAIRQRVRAFLDGG